MSSSDAIQAANNDLNSSEAHTEAQSLENRALQESKSKVNVFLFILLSSFGGLCLEKDEYESRCYSLIRKFRNDAQGQDAMSDDQNGVADTLVVSSPSSSKGQTIGPFENCAHHRTGLFSTIYKCQSRTLDAGQYLAIKVTSPASEEPPHDSKREIRMLKKAAHPNVVHLLEHERLSGGQLLLAFPFIPATLEDALLTNTKQISPKVHFDLFVAIAHIHSQGILHRDIKPSNILLTPAPTSHHAQTSEYTLVLADFGIAWHSDDPSSEPSNSKITDIGTTCYRAPELLFGDRAYGTGVDLWSAGCVAAEIIVHNSTNVNAPAAFRPSSSEAHSSSLSSSSPPTSGWTLFDTGPLGSELALVKSIFETLGTPNEICWPVSSITSS